MKLKMLKSYERRIEETVPNLHFCCYCELILKPRNRDAVVFERKLTHLLYFRVSIVLAIIVFVIQPPTF